MKHWISSLFIFIILIVPICVSSDQNSTNEVQIEQNSLSTELSDSIMYQNPLKQNIENDTISENIPYNYDTFITQREDLDREEQLNKKFSQIVNGSSDLTENSCDCEQNSNIISSQGNDQERKVESAPIINLASYSTVVDTPIYFPDLCYAKIDLTIFIGSYSTSSSKLTVTVANPDNTEIRYLRIYVNGVQKDAKLTDYDGSTTRTFDSQAWFTASHSFVLGIEVYCGSQGKGWTLESVSISNAQFSINAWGAPNEYGIKTGSYYIFNTTYAYITNDNGANFDIEAYFTQTSGIQRYIYLYINDIYQSRIAVYSGSVIWHISSHFNNQLMKFEFKVYVPCSYCYENWKLVSWNLRYADSITTNLFKDTFIIATDWIPSNEVQNDIRLGVKWFSKVIFNALHAQFFFRDFEFQWNKIPSTCPTVGTYLCNPGHMNIYEYDIPGRSDPDRPFADGGKIYFSSESINGFFEYSWETLNKIYPFWPQTQVYMISHEVGHSVFELVDQYDESDYDTLNNHCSHFIMGKVWYLGMDPYFGHRREVQLDSTCYRGGSLPPNYVSDLDYIYYNGNYHNLNMLYFNNFLISVNYGSLDNHIILYNNYN